MSITLTNNGDGVFSLGDNNQIDNQVTHIKSICDPKAKDEAISILANMVKLVEDLDDINTKGDLLDDFDRLRVEILSHTPEKSKIERALRRVESILTPIKHVTTVSTLLIHLNTLLPVISTAIGTTI